MHRGLVLNLNSNTGWRVLLVGGDWNDGSNAGLFYFNANNASSNANTNIGARPLVIFRFDRADSSAPLGENIAR